MIAHIKDHINYNIFTYGLIIILVASTITRLINLNYNSPFNDEAIYVVLGRFGIFQGDWWTYNAASWMAGQPYIYPTMSAIAYVFGGIVGSRLLNVVIGALTVEAIFGFTLLIAQGTLRERAASALIASIVVAASAVGFYVSRLATYDLPSFYFLILGLLYLWRGMQPASNFGKWYFLASTLLFFAFMTKVVIALYIPIIVIYSGWKSYQLGKTNFSFWKKYFFLPLLILMSLYSLYNLNSLLTYSSGQVVRDKSALFKILNTYWDNSKYAWILWGVGSVGMFLKKQWGLWLGFTLLSLIIFLPHLFLLRFPTLDKHTFLTILFLAPIIGIGIKNVLTSPIPRFLQFTFTTFVVAGLVLYCVASYIDAQKFNRQWDNSNKVLQHLSSVTQPGDKILAEVGAGAILVNYDKNYPIYTSTFDWFTYHNLLGEKAYLAAIKDGYFDLIELDGKSEKSETYHSHMHNLVLDQIQGNYDKIYEDSGYLIYRRSF